MIEKIRNLRLTKKEVRSILRLYFFFCEWESKDKFCSHALSADDVDMFIVCLNNFFYNSKSQAGFPVYLFPGK